MCSKYRCGKLNEQKLWMESSSKTTGSIELDDSSLWQSNVHHVWVFKTEQKKVTLHSQNTWDFSCHFRNSQLKELLICQPRCEPILVEILLRALDTTGSPPLCFQKSTWPWERGTSWQDKFLGCQNVNSSTNVDSYPAFPFCTSWGWFFVPLWSRVFLHQTSVCKILFTTNKRLLQRLHLWWEISFISIQSNYNKKNHRSFNIRPSVRRQVTWPRARDLLPLPWPHCPSTSVVEPVPSISQNNNRTS